MWIKSYFSQKGRYLALLIGQFIVLLGCGIYIANVCLSNTFPALQAKHYFQQTDCFLVGKRLMAKGDIVQRYRADFLISYNAGNVQYNRWVSGNGLSFALRQNKNEQEAVLSQYDVGQTYSCRYNPIDPQTVLLVVPNNWNIFFPLLIPAVISAILLYYFLSCLLQWNVLIRNKECVT